MEANKSLQESSLTDEKLLLMSKIEELKTYTDGRIDKTEEEYKEQILAVE